MREVPGYAIASLFAKLATIFAKRATIFAKRAAFSGQKQGLRRRLQDSALRRGHQIAALLVGTHASMFSSAATAYSF